MTPTEIFCLIEREPRATLRKFQLMKVFHHLLPADAKTLSADAVAAVIATRLMASPNTEVH